MSPYISNVILENDSDFQALMGQKIIVTGGGGSLGVALSIALQQKGIECVVTDKEGFSGAKLGFSSSLSGR
jgi:FlaA1/EpsC-like NDP-sugar epimerase